MTDDARDKAVLEAIELLLSFSPSDEPYRLAIENVMHDRARLAERCERQAAEIARLNSIHFGAPKPAKTTEPDSLDGPFGSRNIGF